MNSIINRRTIWQCNFFTSPLQYICILITIETTEPVLNESHHFHLTLFRSEFHACTMISRHESLGAAAVLARLPAFARAATNLRKAVRSGLQPRDRVDATMTEQSNVRAVQEEIKQPTIQKKIIFAMSYKGLSKQYLSRPWIRQRQSACGPS